MAVERCCGQRKYGGDIRWKIVKGNFCAETFFLLQYKFVHIFLHIIIHDKCECAFVCSVHFFFNINLSKIVFAMIGTRMGLFVLLQDPRKEGHLCQSFPWSGIKKFSTEDFPTQENRPKIFYLFLHWFRQIVHRPGKIKTSFTLTDIFVAQYPQLGSYNRTNNCDAMVGPLKNSPLIMYFSGTNL